MLGKGSDDTQIRAAFAGVHLAGYGTKIALLGLASDFGRCERWIRYGVACYLASSSEDDRIIQALRLSDQQNLVVVDVCFQVPLVQIVRLLEPQPTLSQRELQLLKLGAAGLHTDEIAAGLHLTRHTVEFHFRNILSKLGARNRTQAVARGIILGLVSSADCADACVS